MGVFERTLGRLVAQKASAATVTLTPHGTAAFPNLNYDTYVREGYMKNELVFACIEEWCTDIAEAQIQAYNDGDDGADVVDNHDCVELLNHPNPWLSGDDYLGGIQMYKRIAGNSFTLKVRSQATKVVQLWLLRPDRVKVVPDRDKFISHYEYRIGAELFMLKPEDVIHHKTRHPFDDFYGMPPLMPASGRVDIDNFMRDMIKGTLENSGMPAGILQVADKLSEQEKGLLRSRFRNEFGGKSSGNITISDDSKEAPKYTPMGMPLGTRGLVIPELDEIDETRIVMAFRVPQSVIGTRLSQTSGVSFAARESDRRFFTEQQLVPEWKSLASVFTDRLLLPDFGGAKRLEFDLGTVKSLSENQDALATRVASLVAAGIMSIEEGRDALGMPADPDAKHTFMIPFSVTPTPWAEVLEPPEPAPLQLPPGQEMETVPPTPQKQLNGNSPQVIVINAQQGDVRKLFEYDDDGNIKAITEHANV